MADGPPVWHRPHSLGFAEALRGFCGLVAPLLAGFCLAAIATIVTGKVQARLADWAVTALVCAVVFLLLSMELAPLALTQSSSPDAILSWHPEATVSEEALEEARAAQAAGFREMTRLGRLSFQAYEGGLLAFLLAVLLLIVPHRWSVASGGAFALALIAFVLEVWWVAANHLDLPHPIVRDVEPTHSAAWDGTTPPKLDAVGFASVLDPERRVAAGLPNLPAD